MNDCIERKKAIELIQPHVKPQTVYGQGYLQAIEHATDILELMPAADVQPEKISKWCPPLMGQGKCDTYCERCHGKIMRNSTGIFEKTPFCPHCGARMDGDIND